MFSPPSASSACSNSLKSINSPPAAAVVNLEGIERMEPLKGASWGSKGVVSGAAVAVWAGFGHGPLCRQSRGGLRHKLVAVVPESR